MDETVLMWSLECGSSGSEYLWVKSSAVYLSNIPNVQWKDKDQITTAVTKWGKWVHTQQLLTYSNAEIQPGPCCWLLDLGLVLLSDKDFPWFLVPSSETIPLNEK